MITIAILSSMLLFEQEVGAVKCNISLGCGLLPGWINETMSAMHSAARGGALEEEVLKPDQRRPGPPPSPRLVRRAPSTAPNLV